MKGFLFFNNKNGQLIYHKYYTENAKLSKLPDQLNQQFDGQDPMQIASHFFALLKMTEIMVEEFKTEHPDQFESDVNTNMALKSGFKAYRSEGLDYFLEHHDQFPITLVLFYDADLLHDHMMKVLTVKILDVFVYKYEKKFAKGKFMISTKESDNTLDQALTLIFEDTLIEWVKMVFIDLSAQSILIPWIYLIYNGEFQNCIKADEPHSPSGRKVNQINASNVNSTMKKSSYQNSISRSDINMRNAQTSSANINRSNNPIIGNTGLGVQGNNTGGATGLNHYNSNINDSAELEIEFGYCSEEESIFESFNQDIERVLPKIKKTFSVKEDTKTCKMQVKDMLKRYTEKSRTCEFMIKFKVDMENDQDSSSIYSISGTTPTAQIDERDKKKFLKQELKIGHQSTLFNKDFNEKAILSYILELIYKSNSLIDLINPNDTLKILEMSINRQDIMLDKSKLIILKIGKLYLVMPITITKVETRLRNVFINETPKLEGLQRFLQFYLQTYTSPLASRPNGAQTKK